MRCILGDRPAKCLLVMYLFRFGKGTMVLLKLAEG
jgi:hypothetical protein